jgi:type VI protein secretion system component Hcp
MGLLGFGVRALLAVAALTISAGGSRAFAAGDDVAAVALVADDGSTYAGEADVTGPVAVLSRPRSEATSAMYLKVPGIDGSSTVKGFNRWSALDQFAFGASVPVDTSIGVRGGKPVATALNLQKPVDAATVFLEEYLVSNQVANGDTFADALAGGPPQVFAQVALKNATVVSDQLTGGFGSAPVENVSIGFGAIQFCWYHPAFSGSADVCQSFDYTTDLPGTYAPGPRPGVR